MAKKSKQDELILLLKPAIVFMNKNDFNYLIVAGKNEAYSRHAHGDIQDLSGMIESFAREHDQVARLLIDAVEQIKK